MHLPNSKYIFYLKLGQHFYKTVCLMTTRIDRKKIIYRDMRNRFSHNLKKYVGRKILPLYSL